MLRTSGDTSWSDGEGGGAAKATVPSSREAASTLKAFIAVYSFSRPVLALNVKGNNGHAVIIATLGPENSDSSLSTK